jgi:hypothetical protein
MVFAIEVILERRLDIRFGNTDTDEWCYMVAEIGMQLFAGIVYNLHFFLRSIYGGL